MKPAITVTIGQATSLWIGLCVLVILLVNDAAVCAGTPVCFGNTSFSGSVISGSSVFGVASQANSGGLTPSTGITVESAGASDNLGFTYFPTSFSYSWGFSVTTSTVSFVVGPMSISEANASPNPAFNAVEVNITSLPDSGGPDPYTFETSVGGAVGGGGFSIDVALGSSPNNGATSALVANLPNTISGAGSYASKINAGGSSYLYSYTTDLNIAAGTATGPGITPPSTPGGPKGPPVSCTLVCGPCGNWHCPDTTTANPIVYPTGQIVLSPADIADPTSGGYLSAHRSYDNLCSSDFDGPNGWDWFTDRVPFVVQTDGTNNHVAVMSVPSHAVYFDLSGSTYVLSYPVQGLIQTLTHDSIGHTFTYREVTANGKVQTWMFQDCDQTTYTAGVFCSYVDTYGVATSVASYYNGMIGELTRITSSGGVTTIYSLVYNYNNLTGGVGTGKIAQALLRHGTDGINWTIDRQVAYTYHDGTDATGSENDLEKVTVRDPSGNTIDATYYRYWTPIQATGLSVSSSVATVTTSIAHGLSVGSNVTIAGASESACNGTFTVTAVGSSTQFSYSTTGTNESADSGTNITAMTTTLGFPHALKYVLGPASYARLLTNVGDPTTSSLTDSQIATYADNYFEYDGRQSISGVTNSFYRSVTKEIAQGAGCSCSGTNGQGTFTYTRSINSNGSYADGVNNWKYKTVEQMSTMGTVQYTNTVYSNYARQTMLKVYNDGDGTGSPPKWCSYSHFDSGGRVDWEAMPSSVTTYDDTQLNPVSTSTTAYGNLNQTGGLIKLHNYGSSTTATSTTPGDVLGYIKTEQVKQGYTGTVYTTEAFTYWAQTSDAVTAGDGFGAVAYPVATDTKYNTDSGGSPSGPEVTSYAYTYYLNGTLATTWPKTRTTTKPPIVAAQNGPASSNTDTSHADVTTEYYDLFGRVTWTVDPDGYINYSQYDPATGSPVQTVMDVNPSSISSPPVTAPTRITSLPTALNLSTSYVFDGLGRTVKMTDPNSFVTCTTYLDSNQEVRTYPGWQSSTGLPTGPVTVSREHRPAVSPSNDRPYRESLTYAVTSAVATDTNGLPTAAETIGTSGLQTLARTYLDNSNRAIETDSYFSFGSMTYIADGVSSDVGTLSTSPGSGNYYASTIQYDERGRQTRVQNPLAPSRAPFMTG